MVLPALDDSQPSVWGKPADWADFPIEEPVLEQPPDPVPFPRRRRLVALVAAVAVLVAAVALLVARGGPESAHTRIKVAAARTEAVGTLAFTATTTMVAGGQSVTLERLTGESDFSSRRGQFTLVSPANPGLHGTVRYLGDLAYFQYDGLPLPNGAQWTKVSAADLAASPSATAALGGGDPTQSLHVLDGVVGNPVVAGQEVVDGAPTTHYRVQLDLANLIARIGTAVSQISASLATILSAAANRADLHRVSGEVWLDGAGRVRRLDYRVNLTANGVATVEAASLQLTQFGTSVQVSAPPSDQVVAFPVVRDRVEKMLAGQPG